jgi:GNAT superfamily N-acetyltransferase
MAPDAISYRPLTRDDLGAAAALFAAHLPGVAGGRAPAALEGFLARELFDGPWVDPEAPSLVAEDGDGRLLGMIGRQVRPARWGERELRLAWPEHLVVAPQARTRAVGVQLLRRVFAGPYDATVADTASPVVEAVWARLGGTRLDLKAVHWVRVFRPWRWPPRSPRGAWPGPGRGPRWRGPLPCSTPGRWPRPAGGRFPPRPRRRPRS